ncbi:hypothetical protein ACTHHL_03820 [Aeribacillus composti]|uniref:hypothetical protein n=1 Tax=Aeribacillus composti TaxID=1868734 RepID=UPI00406A75BB
MANSSCSKAEVVEVIRVVIISGTGNSEKDPISEIVQYWSKDGELLFIQKNN